MYGACVFQVYDAILCKVYGYGAIIFLACDSLYLMYMNAIVLLVSDAILFEVHPAWIVVSLLK